jgi:hypothetical protein
MTAWWVWLVRDGKRLLPIAAFDTEHEATEWMKSQFDIPTMTRAVYYDTVD